MCYPFIGDTYTYRGSGIAMRNPNNIKPPNRALWKRLIFPFILLATFMSCFTYCYANFEEVISGTSYNDSVEISESGTVRDISSDTVYLRLYESLPTGSYPSLPPDLELTYDNSDAAADPTNGITVLRIRPYHYAGYFTEAWYEDSDGTDTKLAYFGDTTNDDEYLNDADNDFEFTWDTDDYFYLGHTERFMYVDVDLETNGVGGTLTWEYWDGSSWESLTVTDYAYGAKDFLYNGLFYLTIPADWTAKVITEVVGRTWKSCYWIRASENASYSTDPKEDAIRIGGIKSTTYHIRVVVFDGNTFKVQDKYDNRWTIRPN